MIIAKECYDEMLSSPSREIKARVELFDGSTLVNTFTYDGSLIDFTVSRIGDKSKFFGFGICQKAVVKLRDKDRQIEIKKGQGIEIAMGVGCDYLYPSPIFYVDTITRDENNNNLTIEAYDILYRAPGIKLGDIDSPAAYSIGDFAHAVGAALGIPVKVPDLVAFDLEYTNGANFEGTEDLREVLNDIAEATGTIYYINSDWELVFKRLDKAGDAVLNIDKSKYFTLKSKEPYVLGGIVHATDLGDNVGIGEGTLQYVRNNSFWELREDVDTLITQAVAELGGLTITPFELKWRGNFLLEIGDKISVANKDNVIFHTFVLDDTFTYNGGFSGTTQWEYTSSESEDEYNPTTLGESLKYTYAKVDKQEQKIELAVKDIGSNNQAITQLQLDTAGITASVSAVDQKIIDEIQNVNDELTNVRQTAEAKMSPTDVSIAIRAELSNGVDKVTTETGYRFDNEGLTISKTGSEMTTQVTEDGMTVYRDSTPVLIANNEGVNAEDLEATTYLIVGGSRFERYGNRTGCFWIG